MKTAEKGHAAHILMIESDANTLHLMRDAFARANYIVRAATSGWDALKRMKDGPVDAVICELNMPDMEGAELREKCAVMPQTRDIPFIFLTAANETDEQVQALRLGVDDCVAKPIDPVVLVARVQAVLERRRAYEQMVRVDPLTRLLNRASLETEVKEELRRLDRYRRVASMVLLDVDAFDDANEQKGYAMADVLLTCLAGLILSNVRAMDVAGRFRGGKFLLFLPETGLAGAETFTGRIQSQLTQIAEALTGDNLTFSAGIVTAPEDGTDYDLLTERAELAMHHAKGRDKGSYAVWQMDVGDEAKPRD